MNPSRFETFKPKLRSGRIVPQKNQFLYETNEPFDQIVLPMELIRLVLFFNGELSVREIVTEVYNGKAGVQFKLIYNAIYELKNRGFFENGDELSPNTSRSIGSNNEPYFRIRPLLNIYLGRRVSNDRTYPFIFYVLSLITVIFSFVGLTYALQDIQHINFVQISLNPYSYLLSTFFSFSFLLSGKNLLRALLLLLSTGKIYNLEVVFNGLALYFRSGSESSRLISDKLFSTLLFMATAVSPLFFVFLLNVFSSQVTNIEILWISAFILVYSAFDPFSSNEFSSYFKNIQSDEALKRMEYIFGRSSVMQSIQSNDRLWSSISKNLFIILAISWVLVGSYFTLYLYSLGGHTLLNQVTYGHLFTKAGNLALLCLPLAGFTMLIINLGWFLLRLVRPYFESFNLFLKKMKWRRRVQSHPFDSLLPILQDLPLFSYFRDKELKTILESSTILNLSPGESILTKGDAGDELYVLLEGHLNVHTEASNLSKPISEIHPTSIFGEWAVLEKQPRGATVVTKTSATILEVPGKVLKSIAEKNTEIREMDQFVKSIMVNQFFTSAPMFRDLPKDLILQFTVKGQIENVARQKIICKQGDSGNSFYLILRGTVLVTVNGQHVSKIGQGGFFGEISALVDIPCTATISTLEDCIFFRLPFSGLWELLSESIELAIVIETIAQQRLKEDIQKGSQLYL